MKVKPDPTYKQPKRPYEYHPFGKNRAVIKRNVADNTHPRMVNIDDIHKGQTAWIFGSGVSLDEVWDWNIPKGVITIALNAGALYFWNQDEPIRYTKIAPASLYRRKMDYWFAFDLRVSYPRLQPEWDYYNLAMRHPTAKKMIPVYFPSIPGIPNVYKFTLQNKHTKFYRPSKNQLITGDSILTPALHYCYLTGFKKIFLSGIDLCLLKKGNGTNPTRYHTAMNKMKWRGNHLNFTGRQIKAPNGELVQINPMYKRHMLQIMAQIRHLQGDGIDIYKTSLRGMLSINAIDKESTMRALINGSKEIRYAK